MRGNWWSCEAQQGEKVHPLRAPQRGHNVALRAAPCHLSIGDYADLLHGQGKKVTPSDSQTATVSQITHHETQRPLLPQHPTFTALVSRPFEHVGLGVVPCSVESARHPLGF